MRTTWLSYVSHHQKHRTTKRVLALDDNNGPMNRNT